MLTSGQIIKTFCMYIKFHKKKGMPPRISRLSGDLLVPKLVFIIDQFTRPAFNHGVIIVVI